MNPSRKRHPHFDGDVVSRLPFWAQTFDICDPVERCLLSPVEVFQRAKEDRLLLKILENRSHLWIGHIIRHN